MKKLIVLVFIFLLIGGAGAAAYWYKTKGSDYGATRPPKDLTGVIVVPPSFPMKGRTFTVPGTDTLSVTLDLGSPTARRDFPMGRFTLPDGVVGELIALDDYVTEEGNGKRAVPISVKVGDAYPLYYLAILGGEEMQHATSLPLGTNIRVESIVRNGDQVSVNYLVHDREQDPAELPTVPTTAIFDISAGTVVQAGRNPSTEEYNFIKTFAGKYFWKDTTLSDGTVVAPTTTKVFSWYFSGTNFSLGTDCNTADAPFVVGNGTSSDFKVGELVQTKRFCDTPFELAYFDMVRKIINYQEATDGTITFSLDGGGKMVFEREGAQLEFAADQGSSTEDILKEEEAKKTE